MSQPVIIARAVVQGLVVSVADFRAFYTWRTWLGAWLVRIVCQVAFYSMIGAMVGDDDYVLYVIIGAAMMACVAEVLMTVASTTWDQYSGTLPLLVGAPVEPGFFYFGRSLMWPLSATATTSVAMLLMSFFFDFTWPLAQIPFLILLIAVTALSTYCFALVVGAFAMLHVGARNVMSAVITMTVTCFSGALVPVDFWPPALQWAAQAMPVTHGLEAVRGLESGAPATEVAMSAGLTLLTGASWFVLALFLFRRNFSFVRRRGSLIM